MPALAAPVGSRIEESIRDCLIVRRLEESEESYPILVGLVVKPVADSGDTSYNLALPLCDEVLCLGVLEEGIAGSGEQQLNVPTQRRDPNRVPRVKSVRKVDEAFEIPPAARCSNARRLNQMTPSSLPIDPNCSRAKSICSKV